MKEFFKKHTTSNKKENKTRLKLKPQKMIFKDKKKKS